MKILLVDDSAAMRQIQRKILVGLGVTEVIEAGDGQAAVKAAGTEKPDLIMMDWNMPTMTGIEALKQIKATPDLKAIPVIMVTSESEKENIVEAIKAGAASYVVKPFNGASIREKLEPYLKA